MRGFCQVIAICVLGLFLIGAADTTRNRFQEAVAFEIENELTELIEQYLIDQGIDRSEHPPQNPIVNVLASIEETSPEPWLQAIEAKIELPAGLGETAQIQHLLQTYFLSRGFSLLSTDTEKPVATIEVVVASTVATTNSFSASRITQYLLLVSNGILVVVFLAWLYRSRRTRWLSHFPQLPNWMPASEVSIATMQETGSIDLVSPEHIRQYFKAVPIAEAIKMLTQLDTHTRQQVLDVLKIQDVVRGRIEKRMQRIRQEVRVDS